MKILAIETSCDETAISLVEAQGDFSNGSATLEILGNALLSQVDIHKEFGGVFPAVAKREHSRNLVPLLQSVLEQAFGNTRTQEPNAKQIQKAEIQTLKTILEREPELFAMLSVFLTSYDTPDIDAIAVTAGPGLEPTLWVGINFAKALARTWGKPVIPVNHMEGHVISSLMRRDENTNTQQARYKLPEVKLPLLSLLISGGHTELVLMKKWGSYEVIGNTRDDAVGEAFDKAARMLGLPYPGGPEISRLAAEARDQGLQESVSLPRPMLGDDTLDFSFSGLKTSVLYYVRDHLSAQAGVPLDEQAKRQLALAFENAVVDVLREKTKRAVERYGAQALTIGGGVSANQTIRDDFEKTFTDIDCHIPGRELTTDNALMIAGAAYLRALLDGTNANPEDIRAEGNLGLE